MTITSSSIANTLLPFTLKNDYLFRVIMQKCEDIRLEFLSTFLDIPITDIKSAEITNPIKLGDSIDDKTYILDVNVTLNNESSIVTELQIVNEHNWPERSLGYLCREFDNLNRGDDYINLKPAILISILDFTLFIDNPKFHSIYCLSDTENHYIYTSKFSIHVLDLTQINQASEGQEKLVFWAKMFNATTQEEFDMLATENQLASTMSDAMKKFYEQKNIADQCRAREDYYNRKRAIEELINKQSSTITNLKTQNSAQADTITSLKTQNSKQANRIAELEALLADKNK